ncbi:hypothetical protein JKP88DRAFT_294904 [Tribonema minus]|uniref:Uncharacterized protein n=1 Tax=Tribonema minus TaxID=303371 RepID=A0A836CQB4_9STRA|nr:hypothetical protein JKP88DRAFT_294904 [Tribonema minus]
MDGDHSPRGEKPSSSIIRGKKRKARRDQEADEQAEMEESTCVGDSGGSVNRHQEAEADGEEAAAVAHEHQRVAQQLQTAQQLARLMGGQQQQPRQRQRRQRRAAPDPQQAEHAEDYTPSASGAHVTSCLEVRNTDTGQGLFATAAIPPGSVFPMAAIAIPAAQAQGDFIREVNQQGGDWYILPPQPNTRLDADPAHARLRALHPGWHFAARIGEARAADAANCELVPSPYTTLATLQQRARDGRPMVGAYAVTISYAPPGAQLLTHRGAAAAAATATAAAVAGGGGGGGSAPDTYPRAAQRPRGMAADAEQLVMHVLNGLVAQSREEPPPSADAPPLIKTFTL